MVIIRLRTVLIMILSFSTLVFPWSGHSIYTFLVMKHSEVDLDFFVKIRPKDFEEERIYNQEGKLKEYLVEDISGMNGTGLIE